MSDQTTEGDRIFRLLTRVPDCQQHDLSRGEFCYSRMENGSIKWLHFWPHDSKVPISAAIRPHQVNGRGASWELFGTEDRPTLRPSVDARGVWHGFLTNGVASQ